MGDQLAAEITLLKSLRTEQLKPRWKALYGTEAPSRISRDLLAHALAYRIQERALGGLNAATRRVLERAADAAGERRPINVAAARKVGPGTLQLRE